MIKLDFTKLERVVSLPDGWSARCPVCYYLDGRDKSGNHLKIYKNGAFNCIVNSGNREHNKNILSIAGINGTHSIEYHTDHETNFVKPLQYFDDTVLNRLTKNYLYWMDRGVSEETMKQFEGGVAIDGKLNGRYVFPLRDVEKRIVGFAARFTCPIPENSIIPKWKLLGKKSYSIFPRNAEDQIKNSKRVILTESIGCVLGLYDRGIKNALCIFGTELSSAMISYLMQFNLDKIVISLNNEDSGIGNEAANKLKQSLDNFFLSDKVTIHLPKKKDFLEMDKDQFDNWIEEYNKL